MAEANQVIRDFLFTRMYRHWRVNRAMQKRKRVTAAAVPACCTAARRCCRDDWRGRAGEPGSAACARMVGDYIAGMTDRYALEEHRRLTDLNIAG